MNKILSIIVLCLFFQAAEGQILKKIIDKTKRKTEEKVSEKVAEKASDAVTKPMNEDKDEEEETDGKTGGQEAGMKKDTTERDTEAAIAKLTMYSKFDFVPGEEVLAYEDFAKDAIGDFPARWNTDASGEVVSVEGEKGHWFFINKRGIFIPEFIPGLPDNVTIEYDILWGKEFNNSSSTLDLYLIDGERGPNLLRHYSILSGKRSGIKLGFHATHGRSRSARAYIQTYDQAQRIINNQTDTKQLDEKDGKYEIHMAIWRQGQRLRVYVNEEKMFDLPRAFAKGNKYHIIVLETPQAFYGESDGYLVSNLRVAAGAPDTRSKLISEGKFSTTGILFDVDSDRIRPESYAILKNIAGVLRDNPSVHVKIVGHTDSDGEDVYNMELSKKRAIAVQHALISAFGISEERLETDGMGESQPVGDNSTIEGKANNRRVEFIKT